MKSNFIALLMIVFALEAEAQPTQTVEPFKPVPAVKPEQTTPNLHLDDWNKGVVPKQSPPGLTIYFDYTKFFEWLLPRKHPKIPPECDPDFFLRDSIPAPPVIKRDSVRITKPPV